MERPKTLDGFLREVYNGLELSELLCKWCHKSIVEENRGCLRHEAIQEKVAELALLEREGART